MKHHASTLPSLQHTYREHRLFPPDTNAMPKHFPKGPIADVNASPKKCGGEESRFPMYVLQ